MAQYNVAWSLVNEIFILYTERFTFTIEAQMELQRLLLEFGLEKFLKFRQYLYKTLILAPINTGIVQEYDAEQASYTITGETVLRLYLHWKINDMKESGWNFVPLHPGKTLVYKPK